MLCISVTDCVSRSLKPSILFNFEQPENKYANDSVADTDSLKIACVTVLLLDYGKPIVSLLEWSVFQLS